MIEPGPSLAELAAEEFARRRDTARRKVAAGALDPHAANCHLLPWLALAARVGADLDELWHETEIIAPSSRAGEPVRVRILSDEIASLSDIRIAVASARDVAVDRADGGLDPVRNDRARRLEVLAIAVGAPPYRTSPALVKEHA